MGTISSGIGLISGFPIDDIVDQLMAVVATVWHDEDGDSTQDADEPSATFSSKIAKMVVYEDEASGS